VNEPVGTESHLAIRVGLRLSAGDIEVSQFNWVKRSFCYESLLMSKQETAWKDLNQILLTNFMHEPKICSSHSVTATSGTLEQR